MAVAASVICDLGFWLAALLFSIASLIAAKGSASDFRSLDNEERVIRVAPAWRDVECLGLGPAAGVVEVGTDNKAVLVVVHSKPHLRDQAIC